MWRSNIKQALPKASEHTVKLIENLCDDELRKIEMTPSWQHHYRFTVWRLAYWKRRCQQSSCSHWPQRSCGEVKDKQRTFLLWPFHKSNTVLTEMFRPLLHIQRTENKASIRRVGEEKALANWKSNKRSIESKSTCNFKLLLSLDLTHYNCARQSPPKKKFAMRFQKHCSKTANFFL
jgi:hypothetical protein